jgi:hypothetical protein
MVIEWLALLLPSCEVSGSNISLKSSYPEVFLWSSFVIPSTGYEEKTFNTF